MWMKYITHTVMISQHDPSSSSSMKKGLQEGTEDSPHKKKGDSLGLGSGSGTGTVKGSEGVVLTRALLRTR